MKAKVFKVPKLIRQEGESELHFWRRQLFERLAYGFFVIGSIIVIPSAIGGFVNGVPFVGIFDIATYIGFLFVYFNKNLPLRYRQYIIELAFLIGLAMLLALGPVGAGFVWLFAYGLFSTILFGDKGSKRSFIVILCSLVLCAVLILLKVPEGILLMNFHWAAFAIVSINMLGLIYVVNYCFAYIINRLEVTFQEQKQATRQFQQKSAALETANQELDNLIYSISHDIRSPLANIQGLAQLGLLDTEDEQLGHYFKRIESSSIRLQEFTEQITNFFKVDKAAPNLAEVNLFELTNHILQDLWGPNMAEFEVSNRIDKNILVKTDPTRLGLILNNLFSNAIKYRSQERSLVLRINAEMKEGAIALSVRDNGIGIKASLLPSIFEIFTRATASSKGSGLGLYIVKQCATQINAQIDVTSEAGKYTCFTLTMPAILDFEK